MSCVSSPTMRVCWNGRLGESFSPSRGVRQGDPLSPYLFVLCMERLSHLINHEVSLGNWKPLRLSARGPRLSHLFFADDLLLFCEASSEQVDLVRDSMLRFCRVSGHRISLAKSKLFVSRNVHYSRASRYSQALQIHLSADLGKYLGVPLLHKRAVKTTFAPLLHRVHSKMACWKGRFLNMAGRSVLIKSVLSSLPFYQMQSLLIPKGILKEIEKISRDFFWNQSEGGRKMHLVSWENIKKDKQQGGIGIKDLVKQNIAFILKLCWGILSKPDALWAQCLRYKYKCGESGMPRVRKKQQQSAVWSAIVAVWDTFKDNVGSRIRNGLSTNIWFDLWSTLDRPLINYVDKNHHLIDSEAKVADFVTASGNWDIDKWNFFFPIDVVNSILTIQPPTSELDDLYTWRPSGDGNFTVKSAYNLLQTQVEQPPDPFWKSIWRWPIPEKVKFFMWQVFQDRLPTNSLRALRGLDESGMCPFECSSEESVLHILRDCEISKSIWLSTTNPIYYNTFFSGNLQDWIRWNASSPLGSSTFRNWPWNKVFALLCWLIWGNRCSKVFENSHHLAHSLINKCKFMLHEDFHKGKLSSQLFNLPSRPDDKWCLPPEGFVRVDVDGSTREGRQAACGGIIRDCNGLWITGFQHRLGMGSSTMAEIHAIQNGLSICKSLGIDRLLIYSDSADAIHSILSGTSSSHPMYQEISEIRSLLLSFKEATLTHAYRDAMTCADFLATTAYTSNMGLTILDSPPAACSSLMRADLGLH